jgi:hypothetical protein
MLPQTETQLIAGAGSELNNCGAACHRWGDYSSMSIDPTDSCTFWITNEYYVDQTGGNAGSWNTRIGSFSFTQPTQCSPAASSPVVPAAPTGLSFTSVTATFIALNWTDNAGNEDGYVIYRSTDNLNFRCWGDRRERHLWKCWRTQSGDVFLEVCVYQGAQHRIDWQSASTTAPGGDINSGGRSHRSDRDLVNGNCRLLTSTALSTATVTIDTSGSLHPYQKSAWSAAYCREATAARTLMIDSL